jgi:hypothetical protein
MKVHLCLALAAQLAVLAGAAETGGGEEAALRVRRQVQSLITVLQQNPALVQQLQQNPVLLQTLQTQLQQQLQQQQQQQQQQPVGVVSPFSLVGNIPLAQAQVSKTQIHKIPFVRLYN